MNQNWNTILGVTCALFLATAVNAQTLPNGKGKAELIEGCTACHGTSLIVQKRRTPEDWKKVVNDMAARESDSTPQDIKNITRYLTTNFGIKKTAPPQTENPPASKHPQR